MNVNRKGKAARLKPDSNSRWNVPNPLDSQNRRSIAMCNVELCTLCEPDFFRGVISCPSGCLTGVGIATFSPGSAVCCEPVIVSPAEPARLRSREGGPPSMRDDFDLRKEITT